MGRRPRRGLTLLDLLVVMGLVALLVYLARLDWRRVHRSPPPPTPTTRPAP